MKKTLIINEGWSDNLGDKAILYSYQKLLQECNYTVDFMDFTRKYEEYISSEILGSNISLVIIIKNIIPMKIKWFIKNFNKMLISLKNKNSYDIIIIGGGQLINNNKYFSLAMYVWTLIFNKNNIHIIGIGCIDNLSFTNKIFYKKALRRVKSIKLRDKQSIKNFNSIFQLSCNRTIDPVFAISKFYPIKVNLKNSIGISFVNYIDYKKYNNYTEEEYINSCLKKIDYEYTKSKNIVLFYTTSVDKFFAQKIIYHYHNKFNILLTIKEINNLEDLLYSIASFEKVISSRMHVLIIAASYGTKLEVIPFSDKLLGFKKEFIDNEQNIGDVYKQIINMLHNVTK